MQTPLSNIPYLQRHRSTLAGAQQPVNSYTLETPQGRVLIDPAADFPHQPNISAILITHTQSEHLAGAANFPGAKLYVPQGDVYLCDGRERYEKLDTTWQAPWDWETRGNFRGHLAGAKNERPAENFLQVAGALREGDEICGFKVLATPGHGKNALTFVTEIKDRKIAFCGDLICEKGKLWNWFDCDWDYGPQTGQKTLLTSARKLLAEKPDVLLPAHGEPIFDAPRALQLLIERLEKVLREYEYQCAPLNFPDNAGPCAGWRELSPHLFQWKTGNCALLVSDTKVGLLVDDGLCHWVPLSERAEFHRHVMEEIKAALGLSRIEIVIPTHYHGDHTENIPEIVASDGARVAALDVICEVLEHPERFNLAAALPWYGTRYDTIAVDTVVPEGGVLRWREYELEFFHLAGQTYYHAGIAVEVDGARVLFCGDAVFGWNSAPEPVLCWNDNEPRERGWMFAAQRMIEYQPDLLVCGHGSALKNPLPLLEAKYAAWQKRLAEFDELNARENRRLFFDPFFEPLENSPEKL